MKRFTLTNTKIFQNLSNIKLPHLGARTIKTGIAVLICSLITSLILRRESPTVACIASIICIQNDIETSVSSGKNRIIGTVLGALIGFAVMFICQSISNNTIMASVVASLGTIITIYICTIVKIYDCIGTAIVMFLLISMNVGQDEWITYSVMRTIDTFVGVIVGINVNKYLFKNSLARVKEKRSQQ